MKSIKIVRHWTDIKQCTSTFLVLDENCQPIFLQPCIERGWLNNQQNISCVVAGVYPLILEYSHKFDRLLWELKGVPNRSECKIHPANFWDQLNGCMAIGDGLSDIDGDGYYDVTNSVDTINEFHLLMGDITETTIEIIDQF